MDLEVDVSPNWFKPVRGNEHLMPGILRRFVESLRYTLPPPEVSDWYAQMEQAFRSGDMQNAYHYFACTPPEDPENCDCDFSSLKSESLAWIHANHRLHNAMIYCRIEKSGIKAALWREVRMDINRSKLGKTAERDLVLVPEFAAQVLSGFLVSSGVPPWC